MDTRGHLVRRSALGLVAGVAATAVLRSPRADDLLLTAETAVGRRRHALFGAWVPGGPDAGADMARQLGRNLDIEHWYQGWGAEVSDFDLDRARAVVARGGIPMVSWEPWDYRAGPDQPKYALRRIAAGAFDPYIKATADRMAELDGTVWLRFAHEMNGTAYPWSIGVNGNTGRHYVAAWRRIVRTFRDRGATNVRFIWCPLVPGPGTARLRSCFPGDSYVSYVGMDGYNAGNEADWGGWLTFDAVFRPLYRELRHLSHRPVIIAEVGCAEGGGDKSEWIRTSFGRRLARHYPAIRAVVWFNEAREADWRLESSTESLAAARRAFSAGPFA